MQFEVLMRFVLGVLIGACIWAMGNRAHARQFEGAVDGQAIKSAFLHTLGAPWMAFRGSL